MDALPRLPTDTAAPVLALLRRESASLVQRLRLWTPARYAAAAPGWGTRGDLVHHLAAELADLGAAAEGQPVRALPRLESDLALADQLAVTADDLVRAGPTDAAARDAVLHVLAHRTDLIGDPVPDALAQALGVPDVVEAGRRVCRTS